MSDEIDAACRKLSEPMRAMICRARRYGFDERPQCRGPWNTGEALRVRGIADGDLLYLTPYGIAVRARLTQANGGGDA